MSVAEALDQVVVPAMRSVFQDGEVTAVTVSFAPELLGGSITLSLTAVGEVFDDLVVQGDVRGYGVDDWRERLRSDMADFVGESTFGWGQNRGV
jgi:hypothetical protein